MATRDFDEIVDALKVKERPTDPAEAEYMDTFTAAMTKIFQDEYRRDFPTGV
jgi:hypothetical protein